jgi:hypothetical protein
MAIGRESVTIRQRKKTRLRAKVKNQESINMAIRCRPTP